MEDRPILEVENLVKRFGAIVPANNLSVTIHSGEIVGLIGTNGAGKTTFLNLVTGYLQADSGSVKVLGRDVAGLSPRQLVTCGVARSFQIPQLFGAKTVIDHVMLAYALAARKERRLLSRLNSEAPRAQAILELSRFGLSDVAETAANQLPQGRRKLLDIVMALALRPMLLLLDEPTSGVSTSEKKPLMDLVLRLIRESGVTVLFVEHDMEIIERYVTRILAFREGRIIADGRPDLVMSNSNVIEAVTGRGGGNLRTALDCPGSLSVTRPV